jgi:chemotaxis protein CheD
MIRTETSRFGKPMCILYPGEYFATKEECILGTVTGATVSVCLYDSTRRIGGMGHFIVPGMIGTEGIVADQIAAHGVLSMEYLMGEIVKLGGDRKYLKAKLFGAGSTSMRVPQKDSVIQSNIKFLKEYFSLEKIEVQSEELGGQDRRKIYFFPTTGQAYRRFQRRNEDSSEFLKLEQEYIDTTFRDKVRYGKVYLFE